MQTKKLVDKYYKVQSYRIWSVEDTKLSTNKQHSLSNKAHDGTPHLQYTTGKIGKKIEYKEVEDKNKNKIDSKE